MLASGNKNWLLKKDRVNKANLYSTILFSLKIQNDKSNVNFIRLG